MLTRRHLIKAAREAFARDGFEHASIEDIAAKAGKTRGAFYDNFEDKEDVFFAIFEDDLIRDQEKIGPLLSKTSTTGQRAEALSNYLAELLRDRQRTLLHLEFKMYAIRHPQRRKRKRLADLHAAMCLRCCMAKVEHLLPELARAGLPEKRKRSLGLATAIDGLALNLLFDPGTLDANQVLRHLRLNVREAMRHG